MEEIWKDIPDFPGYQASNLGRVRSHNKVTKSARFPHRKWADRIIKDKVSAKDHCSRVALWKDGICHDVLVHRVVADTFLGKNSDTNLTVNHKDGNRQNNRVSNLEWCTRRENIQHGFNTGLYDSIMIGCSLVSAEGQRFDFRSLSKASEFLGKCPGYLSDRIKRGNDLAYGMDGNKYKLFVTKPKGVR